jgi:hypothetical protein
MRLLSFGHGYAQTWVAVAIAAASLLAGAGCGPAAPDPPRVDNCVKGDPPEDGKEVVILGTTQGELFVPLKPGAEVTLIHGPQGGQHIHISTRLFALTAGKWQHRFDFIDADTGMAAGGSRELMTACASEWNESHNIRVYIDDSSIDAGTIKLETFLPPELGTSSVTAEMAITLVD